MSDIVIVAATRTPIGAFSGSLSSYSAAGLGEIVVRELLARGKVEAAEVSEMIFGQVLAAGDGQNAARQAAIKAGLSIETPEIGRAHV